MPEVRKHQTRHGRSDLQQEVQVVAGVVGGEHVLNPPDSGAVVLDHMAIAERPE